MSSLPAKIDDLAGLSELAPMLADVIGLLSNDIALVLDADGVIRKVVLGGGGTDGMREVSASWVGRALRDTVSDCTRGKVDALMRDLSSSGVSRPRHLNHPCLDGSQIPVAYTAVRLGGRGPLVAVGRDLRSVSAMQQRLIDAQQEMERSYWKQRQAGQAAHATAGESGPRGRESRLLALVENMQDAVAVTDEGGRLLACNRALASLLELGGTESAEGQQLGRWLTLDEAYLPLAGSAPPGVVSLPRFDACLHTELGRPVQVEVSVTLLAGETQRCVGFILRRKSAHSVATPPDPGLDETSSGLH